MNNIINEENELQQIFPPTLSKSEVQTSNKINTSQQIESNHVYIYKVAH